MRLGDDEPQNLQAALRLAPPLTASDRALSHGRRSAGAPSAFAMTTLTLRSPEVGQVNLIKLCCRSSTTTILTISNNGGESLPLRPSLLSRPTPSAGTPPQRPESESADGFSVTG